MVKRTVTLSSLLSLLVLVGLASVGSNGASFVVTVSQKTLVLYSGEVVNGNYTAAANSIYWQLSGAAYDPANGLVYAANPPNNSVVVFDPKNYSFISEIPVGDYPVWVAVDPENGYVYVVNEGSGTVSVVNPSTDEVVSEIYVGGSPKMAVYDPSDGFLYVVNYLSNGTYAVQLVDRSGVKSSIPLQYPVTTVTYDPVSKYVLVGTTYAVYSMSGNNIVAEAVGHYVYALAVDPSSGYVYGVTGDAVIVFNPYNLGTVGRVPYSTLYTTPYAAVYANGTVYVLTAYHVYAVDIDANSSRLVFSAPVIAHAFYLSYLDMVCADGELVLVGSTPTPVYVINPKNGEGFGIGVDVKDPAVLYDPVTGYVYVANEYSNALYVIDPSTDRVVDIIPSVLQPSSLTYDPKDGYLFVASYYNDTVAEVDPYSGQVIWSVVAGKEPSALVFDTHNDLLYVAYYSTSTVAVVDPNNGSVLDEVPVGSGPVSLTFDPETGLVYVADQGSDSVTVINGTQVANTIRLNFSPTALAFINGSLYVGGGQGEYAYSQSEVAVYRDGKVVANISLSSEPTDIAYHGGLVYITTYGNVESGCLVILNGTEAVKDVNVGVEPTSLTVTPDGTVYVANKGQGTVSIISVSVKPVAVTTTKPNTATSSTAGTSGVTHQQGTGTAVPPVPQGLIVVVAVLEIIAIAVGVSMLKT